MGDIKIGRALLTGWIQPILGAVGLVALTWTPDLFGTGIERIGPGVRPLELKAPAKTLIQREL